MRHHWVVHRKFWRPSAGVVLFALLTLAAGAVGCYDRRGEDPGVIEPVVDADGGAHPAEPDVIEPVVDAGGGDPDAGPSDCYSPAAHLELAYEADAIGCACGPSDEDACIEGVGLVCTDAHWRAVQDGPCAREPECDGDIVESSANCLQDDAYCRELPDGRYCTGPAAPMCPAGSTPIAFDAECPPDAVCWDYSESLRCMRQAYTPEQCAAAGGVAVADPGDGSVTAGGCPDGGTSLGPIDADWDEGGLCCVAGVACGARAGATCTAQQYCAYEEGEYCGAADAEATCQARPSACDADLKPVCGCDGNTYASACEANAAGSGILSSGECA